MTGAPRPQRVLAVSPHLDDAAFSAGAFLAGLAAAGSDVVVVTVLTGNVARPEGFALACQTDKGVSPETDYMALRRGEDAAAMTALGVRPVHLPLLEAPHRGYDSAAALFGPVLPGDADFAELVAEVLGATLDAEFATAPDLVLGPQALGDHIDHRHVRDAVADLTQRRGLRSARWADLPYAIRPGADSPTGVPRAASDGELDAKVAACAAYATQLGFQFSGPTAMAAALRTVRETFDPSV